MSKREQQVIEAIDAYLEQEAVRRLARCDPRSEFALSSNEERRIEVLHDLWISLDRQEIPEELLGKGFAIRELRSHWMRNANPVDQLAQALIDTGQM